MYGSFSKAADKVFISRQGLSQIIARLEEEVGCTLLIRTSLGVQPTEAGQLLLNTGREVLHSYNLCMKKIEQLSSQQLNVVFAPGSYHHVKKVIQQFKSKYPSCQLNIIERVDHECEEEVKSGYAELGLVPGPIYDTTIVGSELFSVPYVAVVQKSHPLASKSVLHLKDLDGHSLLVQGPHHKIYSRLTRSINESHINASVSFVYDALLQFSIIEESPEIVCLSTERVARNAISDQMTCIPCDPCELAWDLTVICSKGVKFSQPAEDLYHMLLHLSKTNS